MSKRAPVTPRTGAVNPTASRTAVADESPLKAAARAAALGPAVVRTTPYAIERDFIDAFYNPHTVTAGVATIVFVLWCYVWFHATDPIVNIKLGLAAAACAFLIFAATFFPDGIMVRPHPAVWRVVGAIAMLYFLIVVFFLFQDLDTTRKILGYYDPKLRVQLPERSYAEDCRMSTPQDPYKWWSTISDEFLLAHAMGYWAKTLVLRDWRIVTCVSVGFEVLEVTFQHWLPNFKECWWDHVIADILICNAGGTVLGLLTLKLVGAKKYHWVKVTEISSITGKANRLLRQFTPRSVESYEWLMFDCPKRFFQVCLLLFVMFLQELNCFFIKYVLWQEPKHHLVIGRLALWGIMALPGLREFYDYITVPSVKRLGMIAWIGAFGLFFETLWNVKMVIEGKYFRTIPFPLHISVPWLAAIALFSIWVVVYFSLPKAVRNSWSCSIVLSPLFYGALFSLLALCLMGNPDLGYLQKEFDSAAAAALCRPFPWLC